MEPVSRGPLEEVGFMKVGYFDLMFTKGYKSERIQAISSYCSYM